jgi:hypothetical protein
MSKTTENLLLADKYGREHFRRGGISVPIYDSYLRSLLETAYSASQDCLPLLQAWAHGWHSENLINESTKI